MPGRCRNVVTPCALCVTPLFLFAFMLQSRMSSAQLPASPLAPGDLKRLEDAFRAHAEKNIRPEYQRSRLRLYVLFLLLRYAALRLGEAVRVDDERDLDLDAGLLRVAGAQVREIPLPAPLTAELRRLFHRDILLAERGRLTALDPGYIRRNFYARAKECGIAPESASPRALRHARAVEMLESGMPMPALQKFLGQPSLESANRLLVYSDDDIDTMTRHYLKREARLKTSARNVFPARVSGLRQSCFMVEVALTTLTGLKLVSVITEESLLNLQLSRGKTVMATVKAPWVVLTRNPAAPGVSNRFAGTVAAVRRSDLVCEVLVDLPEGSRVCALVTTGNADALALAPGEAVTALFKAFAVILALP